MSVRRWKVNTPDERDVARYRDMLGISSLAAKVLLSRGYTDPEQAEKLIKASALEDDPFVLKDMDKAVDRIFVALGNDDLICVFGDYDVDGLTATTLMYRCLTTLGARVVCSLPSRDDTGYGLSRETIDALCEAGVKLIVTVDNGVSAFEEVAYAASLGIDVVVTDHHVTRERYPDAVAVVNPHRCDDPSPFKELAGVGVALKVAAALEGITVSEAVEEYGLLAAIGTIADIMPIADENRYIVKRGLEQFPDCDVLGLRALCEKTGLELEQANEFSVSYTISPHLNAAGRMGNAELALSLLLTEDEEKAEEYAGELIKLNEQRKQEEQRSVTVINDILEQNPCLMSKPVIIVAGSGFHSGVMGIVCSRLVEQHDKPVIIISVDGDEAKGSGRSVDGISLFDIINSCSDLMDKFGGHDMAAGFTMATDRIDEFRERVRQYCHDTADGFKLPYLQVDGEIRNMKEVNEESVGGLRALAPFGSSNKEPCFLIKDAIVGNVYRLGGGRNTRLLLKKDGEQFYAAYFGVDPEEFNYMPGTKLDVVVNYSLYCGHTRSMVSVKIMDLRKSGFTQSDLDSYEEYRRFCFSGRAASDASIRLERADVVRVYKKIRASGLTTGEDAALVGEFGDMPLGRIAACAAVLMEMGLIEVSGTGERRKLTAVANPPKCDLRDSRMFCALSMESL